MKQNYLLLVAILLFTFVWSCTSNKSKKTGVAVKGEKFPPELVSFTPYENNPVFNGTDTTTWDRLIRERGYILKEDGIYKMWYSGYNPDITDEVHLGYATSEDGIHWKRYPENPIYKDYWVEDMCVVHNKNKYYLFAEGLNDIAHLMVSDDGINWQRAGDLDIRKKNGEPISEGQYGTPTAWVENNKWYLFYERGDKAIWLATSTDMKVWTNVQDEPVIECGSTYDKGAVAMDQVVKYKGRYYAYYHATATKPWSVWSSNVATSEDLIHWEKYENNPIVKPNRSSPLIIIDGDKTRLYTMHHPGVCVYFPKK